MTPKSRMTLGLRSEHSYRRAQDRALRSAQAHTRIQAKPNAK